MPSSEPVLLNISKTVQLTFTKLVSLFRQLYRVSFETKIIEDKLFGVAMETNRGNAWLKNMTKVEPFYYFLLILS